MDLGHIVRSSLWLYIASFFSTFLGFVYWLIISSLVPPSLVGRAAAIIALQTLMVAVFSFGLPVGLRRFIGLSMGEKDYQRMFSYLFSSFIFTLAINLPLTAIVLLASFANLSVFSLTSYELFLVATLFLLTFWSPLLTSLFNSILRTKITALAQVISSILKLVLGVSLVFLGFDLLGVMSGFMVASVVTDVLLVSYVLKLFREFRMNFKVKIFQIRELAKAGLPSWIPYILTIIGQSIGVLFIFGFVGGTETGLYYMAFVISLFVYNLPITIQILMFPVLSAMKDGRKRAASRVIRLSLAVTAPIAITLVLYPFLPFLLLGPSYYQGANILRILIIGAILVPIIEGYNIYVYAVGKYAHVTIISTVLNISRIVFYIILISWFSVIGAALAYTLGALVALPSILLSARRIQYQLNWRQYAKTLAMPGILSVLLFFLYIPWFIGIPILFLISFVSYTRLGIVTKADLIEVSQAFLSKEAFAKLNMYARPIIRILYGE